MRFALLAIMSALSLSLLCGAGPAHAQASKTEAPDSTRLDVERLPPEAIDVTRDMFSRGLFLQGVIGGRGFVAGLGRLAQPGAFARVGVGYEFFTWLALAAAFELSLHDTDAPAPPAPSTFELVDAIGELRLQLPLSARAALWLGGEAGIDWVPGNLLSAYGLPDADKLGFIYGGSLGFDWHVLSRHHSLGILAGARLYPNLVGLRDEQTIGIHSAAYLKYVF